MPKKIIFSLYLVLVIGAVVVYWSKIGEPNIKQPIQFNHLKHKEVADCETCHKYIKEQAFASLPVKEDCAACHESPITDSPEEKKLLDFIEKGKNISWARLYELPPHVYFSHKRHVTIGDLECKSCHGYMADQQSPPKKTLVALMMDDCIACHRSAGIKTDCIACHR